jgi:alpha-glucoside transport system substrate-binding protein
VTDTVVSRRFLLAGAVGAATTGWIGGCGRAPRTTQVAVVWSGGELTRFREVLSHYPHPVEVVSVRNDMDAFLSARYRTANQPDVAIFPQIGLIADYARRGWLAEIGPGIAARFARLWNSPLTVDGVLYGAWVKAAHKSLFWYPPGALAGQAPSTWDDFTELVRRLARSGDRAPLAIGAADGWVLTDWFENVLASVADDKEYEALITGGIAWDRPVRTALSRLAEVWSVPNAFPGGGRRALLTQHEESVLQVFVERRAAMVFEGDFVATVAQRFPTSLPLVTFRFPPVAGDQRLLAAGDAAVVFKGSKAGQDLVDWLTGPEKPFRSWSRAGGYLSPQLEPPPQDEGVLSAQLRAATDTGALRFDLSDQLRGSLGGPDGLGTWKILQDFFADVAVRRDPAVEKAVDRTYQRLKHAWEAGS